MLESSPRQPFRVTRRGLLAAGAATGVGLAGISYGPAVLARAAEVDLGLTTDVIDHGVAAVDRNVRTGTAATSGAGTPLLYLLSDGNPVSFNVINGDTGELVGSFPLEPKTVGGYPTVAPDGTAYFSVRDGKSSLIHRYDPATNKVEFLVESPTGDAVVRDLRVDGNMLYGGCYPRTRVFSYNLDTAEVRDYGSAVGGNDGYLWGLEKVGGFLYVGTGMSEGHVIKIDIASGEKTELALPPEYDATLTRFYWFRKVGPLIAMGFSPGMDSGTNTLFWNTETEDWVHDRAIPGFLALNGPLTEATEDGRLWYKSGGEIYEFDATTGKVTATGWAGTGLEDTGEHRTLDMVLVGRGRPGGRPGSWERRAKPMLLGGNNDGSCWRFDPATGEHEFFETAIQGNPLTVNALGVGSDGRVYVPLFLGPGRVARFDPASGTTEALEGPGQADTVFTVGSDLLLGHYPNAVVDRGDPRQEWDYGTNPATEFDLKDDRQDRIVGADSDGTRYAMGTVADYGVSGGALIIVDADGSRHVHRDLVELQSVVTVLWGPDNLVYAGTSDRGGLSSPSSPNDAELLVFDPDSHELVHHGVPVPDNHVVCELALASDGQVWGITKNGHLFAFDRESRTITADIAHGLGGTGSPWGSNCTLVSHPDDGLLYGLADTKLFAFDPISGDWQVLDADHAFKRMDIADDGTIYVADETNIYQVTTSRG